MNKILIVEDDAQTLNVLKLKLSAKKFSFDLALDGEDALKKIKENEYSLVVLDLLIPKINGFDVLKIIREDKKNKDLKVVVFTNLNDPDTKEKVMSLGANLYVAKADMSVNDFMKIVAEYSTIK